MTAYTDKSLVHNETKNQDGIVSDPYIGYRLQLQVIKSYQVKDIGAGAEKLSQVVFLKVTQICTTAVAHSREVYYFLINMSKIN